jgi:hypothetical protein
MAIEKKKSLESVKKMGKTYKNYIIYIKFFLVPYSWKNKEEEGFPCQETIQSKYDLKSVHV